MIAFLKKYSFTSVLVAVFLFLIPFVTSRQLFHGAINGKLFFTLFVSYIFFVITAYKLYKKEISISLTKQYFLLGLFVFGLYGFVSAFLGVNVDQSLWSDIIRSTGVLFVSHIILLAFSWSLLLQKKEDWSLVRHSVIAASSIFGLFYSIGSQGLGLYTGKLLSINLSINGLSIGNETFAGAFMFLAIICTFIELVRADSFQQKKWLYGALILQVVNPLMVNFTLFKGAEFSIANFFGVARASSLVVWFSLVYFGLVSFLSRIGKSRILRGLSFGILVAIVFGLSSLFVDGSKVQQKYIELSTAARLIVWDSALSSLEDRPITGFGPENFGFAMQKNFNSELYLDKNIGEVWFDRAHNVFVETVVTKGIVGLLLSAIVIGLFARSVYRSQKKNNISLQESYILYAFSVGHIVQIFTSFDTVITYVILAFFAAYGLYLEKETVSEYVGNYSKYIASGLIVVTIVSLFFVYIPLKIRQNALYDIFVSSTHEKRLEAISKLDSGALTFEPIRLVASGLVKGVFENTSPMTQEEQKQALLELEAYDSLLVTYIKNNPESYRAKTTLVYIRFAEVFLGNNKLNEETEQLIADAYKLSPGNPLSVVMDSLFDVYTGNLKQASEKLKIAEENFPGVKLVSNTLEYVQAQQKSFPSISFLLLENF